jgi:hypothetical protein
MGVDPLQEGNSVFQTMFSLVARFQVVGKPVASLVPLPWGPRQAGQCSPPQIVLSVANASPNPTVQLRILGVGCAKNKRPAHERTQNRIIALNSTAASSDWFSRRELRAKLQAERESEKKSLSHTGQVVANTGVADWPPKPFAKNKKRPLTACAEQRRLSPAGRSPGAAGR